MAILDPDVVFRQDTGSEPVVPLVGAEGVARRALGGGPQFAAIARPAVVNGGAGIVAARGGRVLGVAGMTIAAGRIVEIDLVTDPAKLRGVTVA